MVAITDYPSLPELEEDLERAFDDAIDEYVEVEEREPFQIVAQRLTIERIYILGDWGRGEAEQGSSPLVARYILSVEDRDGLVAEDGSLSDIPPFELFQSVADEALAESFSPPPTPEVWFGGADLNIIAEDNEEDSLIFFLQQREPNRGYDLTNRNFIRLEGNNIVTELEADEEAEFDAEGLSVVNYRQRSELGDAIEQAFEEAKAELVEEDAEKFEQFVLRQSIAVGEWGRGNAEQGDPLEVMLVIGQTNTGTPSLDNPFFDTRADRITDLMQENFEPPEGFERFFGALELEGVADNLVGLIVVPRINEGFPPRAFNFTDDVIVETSGEDLVSVATPPPGQFEQEGEPIQPEPDAIPEPEEEEEERTEEEILAEKFPDVPRALRPLAVNQEEVKVPISNDTKKVRAREPYDFELELMTVGSAAVGLGRFEEGIGFSKQTMRFGDEDPPGSFPRVGVYIKNHLKYQGPSYPLDIYRDLVTYSAFISDKFSGTFRVGSYDGFREYMWRLREVENAGGPQLIRRLSQNEASSRGLSTVPSLPDGTRAPWLQRREYFELIPENEDHTAWKNPKKAIYGATQ